MTAVRAHAFVSGRVQGVWYRKSTQDQAQALGLKGWVRNLPDGRVELVAIGPRPKVERLLAWCRRGPNLAAVNKVDVTWDERLGLLTLDDPLGGGFEIRR